MCDCNCECPSGNYNCSCCCASVTGLRAGIHPDYIQSIHFDSVIDDDDGSPDRTFQVQPLTGSPIHIVSATASLACVRRDLDAASAVELNKQILEPSRTDAAPSQATPLMFSLFTIPGWSDASYTQGGFNPYDTIGDGRQYIATGAVSSGSPSWESPADLFGYFCDGGVFLEINAPTSNYGVRVVVNYIDRAAFSPAYGDPIAVLQHYWSCANGGTEFLDGFYGGNTLDISGTSSPDDTDDTAGGEVSGDNPWTFGTEYTELGGT